MFANKGVTVLFSTITFILSSSVALAAENSSASFAGWPILALLAAVFIFRKKIFAETTVEESETKQKVEVKTKIVEKKTTVPAEEKTKTETKKVTTQAKAATKTKSNSNSIDLNDDSEQCQASTAKGTRCKRTNTLEKTSVIIDGTTYQLTVCSQHNNDSLKPYSKLMKK